MTQSQFLVQEDLVVNGSKDSEKINTKNGTRPCLFLFLHTFDDDVDDSDFDDDSDGDEEEEKTVCRVCFSSWW